ncbi:MAG: hypothetical protein V3T22_04625 [Planctomycetota bacterium]
MREKSKGALGVTVTVDRAALRGLETDLTKERAISRDLRRQLASESELGRKAVEEAVKARKEREEYRRVLAAAIANEKQSLGAAAGLRETAAVLEDQLRDAAHSRGHAEGRAGELDRELGAEVTSHRDSLLEAQQRERAQTLEQQRALERAEYERGVAQGRVRELLPRIPEEVPATARVAAVRARVTLAVAGFSLVLALMFLPDLLRVLLTPGAETLLGVVVGMGAWAHLVLVLGLSVLALSLAALGIRQLRAGERAVRQAAEEGSGAGAALSRPSVEAGSTA